MNPSEFSHQFLQLLRSEYSARANAENAQAMSAYMKNLFPFFGVKTPERRTIFRAFLKQNIPTSWEDVHSTTEILWQQPERELHYCAIEALGAWHKHWHYENMLPLVHELICTQSWWDSVDALNSVVLKRFFTKFPAHEDTITHDWNQSENIWLQRLSITFQLSRGERVRRDILSEHILHLASSKEFFVQKAIGWMLRDFAYTDPEWVRTFVQNHTLAPLSVREAMKHLR